jgi:hypothetical protein
VGREPSPADGRPVVVRVRGFLASDAGILAAIVLLAGTGIAGLFWIQ